ncbi:Uncharacterised protein [Xylophilus ampelinus]|nr:Uncharacterised protein [Xylophilus ampelinus]
MIGRICIREVVERLRDGRLLLAGGVGLVLLITALAVGTRHVNQQEAEQAIARAQDYRDWLGQGHRHPHDAAHQGMHAFKAEPALSIVDPGVNPCLGSVVWLQAHRQSKVKFSPAQDGTGLQQFGLLSAGWVMQVLGPLLVIVLGFNAFSAERESGVLKQTLSLGVASQRLLVGKAAALGVCLLLLLVPAALLAGGGALWLSEPARRLDVAWRFGALCAGYGLYLSIWVFLTLGISALSRTSRVAITVLLALWVAQTVMAPRVLSELSRAMHPSPTRLAFDQALNAELKATSDRVWMQNFGTTERWGPDVPLSKWGLALRLDDQAAYPVFDRHFASLWDTWTRQLHVQEWSGLAVPVLAMRSLSMGLAGTDFSHHRVFAVDAEQHRRRIQDIMSADLVRHADTLDEQHFSYQADPSLWTQVPPFEARSPHATWAMGNQWRAIVALLGAMVLSLAFALISARRQAAA